MIGRLLACWGLLAVLCASSAQSTPRYPQTADIQDHFRYPGVAVEVLWWKCGHPNAFYYPPAKTVVMCLELLDVDEDVARFMFAHEMAHAVIHQLDIPYTVSEEATADELAAYVLVLTGSEMAVSKAADWFATKAMQGWAVHPMDDHPDHVKRAVMLKCLSLGRAGIELKCPRNWDRVLWTWHRLLPTWE